MQVVERGTSVQVLADSGVLLASFPNRSEAAAFEQGFRRGIEHFRAIAKKDAEALGLVIARVQA